MVCGSNEANPHQPAALTSLDKSDLSCCAPRLPTTQLSFPYTRPNIFYLGKHTAASVTLWTLAW